YLYAADLFVLTSDSEGMPGVLLEAGFAGLPAVATDVGGGGECVLHGQTGILVPPQDADALKQALRSLLRNRERRSR
ncbi:MAG: glycosyltransferase, partial [Caldilineaceae bacterium]